MPAPEKIDSAKLAHHFITGDCRQVMPHHNALGGLVLDPFSGSGTTLLACALEGRSGIGIELYPTNNVIAQKRLANLDTTKGES